MIEYVPQSYIQVMAIQYPGWRCTSRWEQADPPGKFTHLVHRAPVRLKLGRIRVGFRELSGRSYRMLVVEILPDVGSGTAGCAVADYDKYIGPCIGCTSIYAG